MSNKTDSTSLSAAEKRFVENVLERYLLTMKSEGIGGVLLLVSAPGHAQEMWEQYSYEGSGLQTGWVMKRDAALLCHRAISSLLACATICHESNFALMSLREIGIPGFDLEVWMSLGGGSHLPLKDFEPRK